MSTDPRAPRRTVSLLVGIQPAGFAGLELDPTRNCTSADMRQATSPVSPPTFGRSGAADELRVYRHRGPQPADTPGATAEPRVRSTAESGMAARRRGGDQRATRRDGPGGAGAGPVVPRQAQAKRASGQQSGSKRPAVKTGAVKRAPKKGEPGE